MSKYNKSTYSKRKEFIRKYWSLHEGREMSFHDVLVDTYITKGLSIRQTAEELGCSGCIIQKWLVEEGITRRKMKFL